MEALFDSDYASNNLIKEEIKNTTTNSTESSSTTTYTNEYNNNNYIIKRVGKTVGLMCRKKKLQQLIPIINNGSLLDTKLN